jgi:hypothetical protein
MNTGYTKEQIISFVAQAQAEARQATEQFLAEHGDRDACGFAWVACYDAKGNTKFGKALAEAGFRKSYEGGMQLWNPSGSYTQAVTAKERGAEAAAEFLTQMLGVKFYAGSRLD